MWKTLGRKTVYESPFLKVYEDAVELPNGQIVDDYTVIEKKDIVIVVAFSSEDELIAIKEYKHAVGEALLTLPAGHINNGEDPVRAGLRELAEETGFTSSSAKYVAEIYDYPSKDSHRVHVILVNNAVKSLEVEHEATEQIECLHFTKDALSESIERGEWKVSSVLAAFLLARIV